MVTFNCEVCNDTVPKKNTEKHYYRCPNAYYTCIDCSKTFDDGVSYKQHTQCISEDEKYQKALFKGKKGQNKNKNQPAKKPEVAKKEESPKKVEKPKSEITDSFKLTKGESLYKTMKKMSDKDAKKKLLKQLVVDDNGNLVLKK